MKFDTRDVKPKLWNIAVLSGVFAVVLAVLFRLGAERYGAALCIAFDIYYPIVLILLLRAFFGQIRYNPYAYNTIFYMGFALFLLAVWILQFTLTVKLIRHPDVYGAEEVLRLLLDSAKTYMLLTSPFLFVFSAALCISNIALIRHEGKRLVNVLGIILSFLLVGGELFLYLLDRVSAGSRAGNMVHALVISLFAAVYLYFECMLTGTIVASSIAARYEPEPDKDFLIILGCGLQEDGTPSPLLKGRVDRALAFAKKQKEQTGKELVFVTSGGQGPDEPVSESASMKQYLLGQGVPEERIIEEDRSTDTFENMKYSKEKIWAADPSGKVAFATTNYHVFRSGLYARRVKMRAVGMGAKTRWWFWPNAAVREFVGLLTAHRLKQALIFGGMAAFYLTLTILVYR